jgi:hypothetical protein
MERYKVTYSIFCGQAGEVVESGDYSSQLLSPEVAVRAIAQLTEDVGNGWSHIALEGPHQSITYDIAPVRLTPAQAREVLEQIYKGKGPQLPGFC